MVLIKSIVLASLASLACAGSAVIDLMPSNFDSLVLKSGKPSLVEFFAPWCGHCKNLAPVYEDLATSFKPQSSKLTIAKADCDAYPELAKKWGVKGFPTLKWFDGKSDTPEDYTGGRDLLSLTNFITDKSGAQAKRLAEKKTDVTFLNDATFDTQVGADKHVFVAFTAPWCGHCKTLAPTWEDLATTFKNEPTVIIAKVDAEAEDSKALAKAQGVASYPTIKYFSKGSKEGIEYDGARTEAGFIEYVNSKSETNREVGGRLGPIAGTILDLDSIVMNWVGRGGDLAATLSDAAGEVTKLVADYTEDFQYKYASYYVRVFDKLRNSDNWAAKELARLENILKKGGLEPAKHDELTVKTNILRKFAYKLDTKIEDAVNAGKEFFAGKEDKDEL